MSRLFSQVFNMSMTGSIVILLVLLARLLLKRSPKIFSYALWSVVLFRLLCPVALTAPVSALNALKPQVQEASESTSIVRYLPGQWEQGRVISFIPAETPAENLMVQPAMPNIAQIASCIWIAGAAAMLLYSVLQYHLLRQKLVGAVAYKGNVYRSDYIDTPFVMGVLRPKIYLPSSIPTNERTFIIAHERHHIRRCDHIIKLLAYCALCIHWFNPMVWAAFILAGKDMEMSCDEAVIQQMGPQIRSAYSASLLRLATHRNIIAGMPLAFGEGDTKGRVMNMANWKKPKLWGSALCLALCVVVLAACAVNPAADNGQPTEEGASQQVTQPPVTNTTEEESVASGSEIRTDTTLIQFGDLNLLLPSELEASDENGALVLTMDEATVGGIALRKQAQENDPNSFSPEWMAEIGVPEASDPTMGYMSGGSNYADYEITYFPDIPVNRDDNGNIIADELGTYMLEHEVTHYFFYTGTDVYDVWFYPNRLPNIPRETVLKSCFLEGRSELDDVVNALSEEQNVLQQCRAVLEQIQGSDACKIDTRQENGSSALNQTSQDTTWICGDDRLHICIIPESGGASLVGRMLVDRAKFECGSTKEWREITWWDSVDPWLARFQWEDSVVAYMDTLTDESGITVMLRIDKPYEEGENQQPHYFVNFHFDTDGAFRDVTVQTNLFQNNAVTRTESIVSMDAEQIKAEIQEEYRNAAE